MSLGLKKERFKLDSKKAVPARHHHPIKRHEKNLRPKASKVFKGMTFVYGAR
jgi:hypothetical protein